MDTMERLCCLFMNVIRETFFYHLRELTPDCGVSIRTSRICMNIH